MATDVELTQDDVGEEELITIVMNTWYEDGESDSELGWYYNLEQLDPIGEGEEYWDPKGPFAMREDAIRNGKLALPDFLSQIAEDMTNERNQDQQA